MGAGWTGVGGWTGLPCAAGGAGGSTGWLTDAGDWPRGVAGEDSQEALTGSPGTEGGGGAGGVGTGVAGSGAGGMRMGRYVLLI